jgi:hypothetical protein
MSAAALMPAASSGEATAIAQSSPPTLRQNRLAPHSRQKARPASTDLDRRSETSEAALLD